MQGNSIEFCGFKLEGGRLWRAADGAEVRLRPKSFEVLTYLAANANRVVTKEEIFGAIWGRTVVTDDSLTQCVIEIRRAIGDDAHELIRTVPRRGFVLVLPGHADAVREGAEPGDRAPPGSSRRRRWPFLAGALAVAAFATWWTWLRPTPGAPVAAAAPPPSIAVLPFVDLSSRQDQRYFAEGLSEEILNQLAQEPGLQVIARTSSFSFRGQHADIAEIARKLDVTYVLEGSVRKAGDRARITAQLVDGSNSRHLWSHIYDRDLHDLLAVQSDIAAMVTRALNVRLARGPAATASRAVEPAALEQYMFGLYLMNRQSPGDLALAQGHVEHAVEIDPEYAHAWALLAGILIARIWNDHADPAARLDETRKAIAHALALAPDDAEVQLRAAEYYSVAGDPVRSLEHWKAAVALQPDNVHVLGESAADAALHGKTASAVAFQRRAVQRDPLGYVNRMNLVIFLEMDGQYEAAWRELAHAREIKPRSATADLEAARLLVMRGRFDDAIVAGERLPDGADRDVVLALAFDGAGRAAEAKREMDRLRARPEKESASRLAQVLAWRGETDEAFRWLSRAIGIAQSEAPSPGTRQAPLNVIDTGFLNPLRADPRFQRLLAPDPAPASVT